MPAYTVYLLEVDDLFIHLYSHFIGKFLRDVLKKKV